MRNRHIISALAGILVTVSAFAAGPVKDTAAVMMSWQQQTGRTLMTSGARSLNEYDLSHHPVADVRRRMRGLFLSAQTIEECGGLAQTGFQTAPFMNSDQISVISRCFGNLACIVDDVPVPFNQYLLDPNQIESITLITDIADKASYGTLASQGAFLIRTKTGGYDTPLRIHADFESGIETPAIWPEYVNGEQYARLNNIARGQAGYNPLYSEQAIRGFALGNPDDLRYPSVDYRSVFYKKAKPVSRFGINASAGSRNIKFNTSLNGIYGSDLIKIGPGTYFSKLNLSTSVSTRIGQYLEANIAFNGMATFSQEGNGGSFYETNYTSPVAFPLVLRIDPDSEYYDESIMGTGMTVYGVSKTNPDNPYAAQIEGGYAREKLRSGMFHSNLDFDMSWLLPGLKSKTFISIATFFAATMGKSEEYLAYYWDMDKVLDGRSITHVGAKSSSESVITTSTFQSLNAYERLSYDLARNRHRLSVNATGMLLNSATSAKHTNTKELALIGTLKYSYADRYVLDLVSNCSGTTQFREDKRWGFFPAVGLAWNVDKEAFLSSAEWLDMFKIRAQYGKTGDFDIFTATDDMYETSYSLSTSTFYHYGPRSGTSWIGNLIEYTSSTKINQLGNDKLTWPVITELDAGFDLSLFNKMDVTFNWYKAVQSGVIVNVSDEFPYSLGNTSGGGVTSVSVGQYGNHDQYTYSGYELGLRWHQDWKDFGYSIGLQGRRWDKTNDIITKNHYSEEYQNAAGRRASEYLGYIYDGIFQTQEEIDSSPLLSSDTQIGDIKYKDVNDDGKLDANDRMYIACANPKLRYSINLGLRYKGFDFNVTGTGQAFCKTFLNSMYFMGGYSTYNYSKFIWDNLYKDAQGNPSAYGKNFPRLTYTYNTNNFQCSDYWLRNGGWFKIHSAELAYNTDFKRLKWIEAARFSLRASNLLTVTGIEYMDPEAPDAGIQSAPLYRTFTIGARFTF